MDKNALKRQEVQEVVRLFGDLNRVGQRAASSSRRQAELYKDLETKNARLKALLADEEVRAGVDALLTEARNLLGQEQDLIELRSQTAPQTTAFIDQEMKINNWFPVKRAEIQKAVEISSKQGVKSRRKGSDRLTSNPFPETSEELLSLLDRTLSESREQLESAKPMPRKAKKAQKKKLGKEFWGCVFGAGIALADVVLAIQAVGLGALIAKTSVTMGGAIFAKSIGFNPKEVIPGLGATEKQAA